jgi:hypothetical protein
VMKFPCQGKTCFEEAYFHNVVYIVIMDVKIWSTSTSNLRQKYLIWSHKEAVQIWIQRFSFHKCTRILEFDQNLSIEFQKTAHNVKYIENVSNNKQLFII